jgi:toxin ParE1/3/4
MVERRRSKSLVVAPAAIRDLRNIRAFLENEAPDAAGDFLEDLTAKIAWIAAVDFTGSPRDHISEGLRLLPYRKRCIYYRSYPDRVVVLRVLHESQDVNGEWFGKSIPPKD